MNGEIYREDLNRNVEIIDLFYATRECLVKLLNLEISKELCEKK